MILQGLMADEVLLLAWGTNFESVRGQKGIDDWFAGALLSRGTRSISWWAIYESFASNFWAPLVRLCLVIGCFRKAALAEKGRLFLFLGKMVSFRSLLLLLLGLLSFSLVLSSPLKPGVNFQTRSSMPVLTLPYASYRAAAYRPSSDLSVYIDRIRRTFDTN